MKVIKYVGVKPKYLNCYGCDAQLEYTPYDVNYYSYKVHEYYYVICPVCGKRCFITEKGDMLND